jgi:hypothetical protein
MPYIGQTWVLASIGAVVEYIEYIETTAYGVYMSTIAVTTSLRNSADISLFRNELHSEYYEGEPD